MCTFIAGRIMKARESSIAEGKAKYKAYFVNTKIYEKYRADVETILITDGYEDCIVSE